MPRGEHQEKCPFHTCPGNKPRLCSGDKEENIDFGLASEAWTQSLVIDFWRSGPFTHTLATLQEHDMVMKKSQDENINCKLDSEVCTLHL